MFKRLPGAALRALLTLLRAAFILMMLIIPIPAGELFHRLLERRRKADAVQVKREE